MQWITALLTAFAFIVPVELPDKTFVATLVMATRYPPLAVWIGVTAAFGVQCLVAVAVGRVIALLPRGPVQIVAAVLFIIGAIVLFWGARKVDDQNAATEQEYAQKVKDRRTGLRAVTASFLVLFLAEWGDLSQLLTASLVASGRPATAVFLGSWIGLTLVAGAGVLLGRVLLRYVRLSLVRYVGAAVCAILAGVTVVTLVQSA